MGVFALAWLILKIIAALGVVGLGLFIAWFIVSAIFSEIDSAVGTIQSARQKSSSHHLPQAVSSPEA
jgi:hypothetical protein